MEDDLTIESQVGEQDLPSVYTNNVEVTATPWDFRLTFGEVVNATKSGITVRPNIRVVMSPQHAKAFANVLLNNVAEYEKRMGAISIPEQTE